MKKILAIFLIATLLFSSCLKREKKVIDNAPKELTIWNLFDDTAVFEGQIQAFSSLYPWVKINYKKFNDIEFYENLLLDQLAEWKWPDIFVIKNTDLQRWKWKLEPLYVWWTDKPMNVQIYKETFLPVLAKDLISDWKIYWISPYVDTLALYYNKQYFEDNFASWKPAKTWKKFTKQVEQLTRTDNSIEKFKISGVAMWRSDNILRSNDILYMLMLQFWTQFYDEKIWKAIFADIQWNRNISWESKKPWEKALTLYTSFWKPLFKNYSWNKEITSKFKDKNELYPFITWKTAAIFWYSYLKKDLDKIISQFRSKWYETISKKDIWVVEVPQVTDFDETWKRDALVSYFPFVVSKNVKNPKLAWDFLNYLWSKESSLDYFEKTNKPSSRLDLIDDQKLEKFYWVFAREATYWKSYPDFVIDSKKYDEIFKNAIQKINDNRAKPSTAISEAQRKIQCLIDKYKKNDIYTKCL